MLNYFILFSLLSCDIVFILFYIFYSYINNKKLLLCINISILCLLIFVSSYVLYAQDFTSYKINASEILIAGIIFVVLVLLIHKEYKLSKQQISNNSLQEGMDELPSAIGFFDKNGIPAFMNHKMYDLNDDIQNLEDIHILFKDKIDHFEVPFYKYNDKYYTYKEEKIMINNYEYSKVVIHDNTEMYELLSEMEEENIILDDHKKQLQDTLLNITTLQKEEELLIAKDKVHDALGECVLYTKQMLDKNEFDEELIDKWNILLRDFKENDVHVLKEERTLNSILEAADLLNCDVVIHDELPASNDLYYCVMSCLKEAIMNGVKHGNAKRVDVYVQLKEDMYIVEISNDGTLPESISFVGGLSTLQKRINKFGGSLHVHIRDKVIMEVLLPKWEEYETNINRRRSIHG